MNHLNLKIISLLVIIMLFFSFKGISQNTQTNTNNIMETINASGANATGSSGTVTYSIGQVFYTYIGQSVYNVAQGIQHEELEKTLTTPENSIEPKTEIFIFPNPTTDFVTINMEGSEFENGLKSYQLYDIQGRILKQNTINQTETQINLTNLSSSIYILQVYANNKVLKTFKILKK
jgi:hypothetical protein